MAQETGVKTSPSQEKYGRVQFAIRLLVLVLFLGWIFIWIMSPTNTFRQAWLPRYKAKTNNTTYFGSKGVINFIHLLQSIFFIHLLLSVFALV